MELKAAAHLPSQAQSAELSSSENRTDNRVLMISDPKLFEILCDLVAEGWLKATRNWEEDKTAPLSFGSQPSGPGKLRRLSPSLTSLPATNELIAPNR
jgi:hypothetical protein